MHTKKTIAILLGVLALATAVALRLRSREPAYAGKPLSYWLTQLGPEVSRGPYSWLPVPNETRASEQTRQAQEAIASMGVEAIPFLLDKVAREHGLGDRAYATIWPALPLAIRERVSPPRQFRSYGNPDSQIVWALELLGTNAVPSLVSALWNPNSDVQVTALAALCGFGANAQTAIPGLTRLARHSNGFVRRWAIFTLGRMGPTRVDAVPILIAALRDSDISPLPGSSARVRETAAEVIGQLGAQAQAAVPELKKLITDSDPGVRQEAVLALWHITRDRELMPTLVAQLDKNEDPRRIIWALAEMGPTARPAVPAIRNALGLLAFQADTYKSKPAAEILPDHWPIGATREEVASEALRRIEPESTNELPAPSFVNTSPLQLTESGVHYAISGGWNTIGDLGSESAPDLVQVLRRDTHPETRIQAMLALGKMNWKPTADLVPTLMRLLDDRSVFKYRGWEDKELGREFVCMADLAAEMLGKIGPDARPALEQLKEMLTDTYWNSRPYAPLAIWRIDHDTNILGSVVSNLESTGSMGLYRRFLAIAAEMRSAAKPAIPAILRGMTNFADDVAEPVRRAVAQIDPDAPARAEENRP